ncbi:MAG TPA: alpha/beta hydrolase-fold protein [Flavitalea sp.]|nr:alpha/beta hydrolase-fold protein [Flavitalea sp.]
MKNSVYSIAVFICFFVADSLCAQTLTGLKGSVERIIVHGKQLEGNLEGDSPDRHVSVYLPAGYKKNKNRRYPVIYFLHGFTDDDAKWYGFEKHWINLPAIADSVFASGNASEMIIVTPNAFTRYQGSMYSNSVTTGNWEQFVATELVGYIDLHYRTIPQAKSRGLAGHSMGGYGTMRIGQKYPDVFSSIYLLSPCCMLPGSNFPDNPESISKIEAVKTFADVEKADFMTKAAFASAAAWSPDPVKPPLFLDMPVKDGQVQTMVQAKWWANMPLATIDQHITEIKQLHAIAFDAGNQDESIARGIKILDSTLNRYAIKHTYEEYQGDHVNRIGQRIREKMLAFFSQNLIFTK